ncbi:cytokine receptor [Musca domestica]|uniref:Cytokine receptor n=1 Tax=Musca domestica TaxID=7370 RepID=A0ABM3VBL7_MUSDO|nr:cytokine receptor [Musca domestica]XP_058983189.1 cytokine receptor [Musca domestica]XP_058983190.1 cytokine receptor [Musca domestica]
MVLFSGHRSHRICFCCWLMILLTLNGYAGLVSAATSVDPPGKVEPKTLSLLIGSNGTITCRLSEPKSSEIWFYKENSERGIYQPSDEIQIIDQYTAALIIQNATEQKSWYQCMVDKQGIGLSQLHVGKSPQNVTDFSCIVYDYEYMQCSFTRPENMLMTEYELEYRFANDNSKHKCKLSEDPEQFQKLHCNITNYLPIRDKYLFTLIGNNAGGRKAQKFVINNHKIVIPSPLELRVQNITSNSATLTWEKIKFSYYRKGLLYEIRIPEANWIRTGTMVHPEDSVIVNNLYSYWTYHVEIRVKSKIVDAQNDRFWSKTSTRTFSTKTKRPDKAPDTPCGSFYIDSTETQLRLYWGHLPEFEHCGPGFHYLVNEIDSDGLVIQSTVVNDTTLSLPWKNVSMQRFSIRSANDIGPSVEDNVINVYRSGSPQYELNENNIAKVYHNSSYTLSWSPPANLNELVNYTVFWCLPKIELPNQCKGPISYKYLDKYTTNFTTEPKDRSLNLAISANYPHYNKGMQWARCSAEVSSELMKVELEVTAINDSSVLVKWNSGSVCSSILKGYNLTYCQVSDERKCISPQHTIQLFREYRNYTIQRLSPYTTVCITMFMFSPSNQGPVSEYTCVRTKASAPSPPKNVLVNRTTVTSKSAKIEWSPPDVLNGILTGYKVYWRKKTYKPFETATIDINQTSFELTGLSSFSDYEVYVTAHTVEESEPSRSVFIQTLIGIPSSPRNISISDYEPVIHWEQPDVPSGQHVFYVVALIHRYTENESVYERVSVVRGRSCRFQVPECTSSKMSYALEVRAVNVGKQNEIDREIKPMNKDVILAGAKIDPSFCKPDSEKENYNYELLVEGDTRSYFASPWIDARHSYYCSPDTKASLYAVAFVILIAFATYLCYWVRNKYYKMKNIKVILPEGLVDQESNYKLAGSTLPKNCALDPGAKKEFHSDISRSNDCLVAFEHKDNLNLISNFHNRSPNPLSSLSSSSSSKDHHNDDNMGEHPSLETTNEELSSNSSASSHSNLNYHSHHQIPKLSEIDSKNTTLDVASVEQLQDEMNSDEIEYNDEDIEPTLNNSGYVTHNTQLLASLLNTAERPVPPSFHTPFPAMTTDGYIQPSAAKQLFQPQIHHPPPPTSQNGYTCIEALSKMTTMPDNGTVQNVTSPTNTALPHSQNFPTNSGPAQTSPVITDLEDIDLRRKDIRSPNAATAGTAVLQQPNNNNNTIYGYVTQQQLANFGTNVALAKELNT